MKETILNKLRDRYKQTHIILEDRMKDSLVAAYPDYDPDTIHSWKQKSKELANGPVQLNANCRAYVYKEFIIYLVGQETYAMHEAYQYFADQKDWIQLFMKYSQSESRTRSLDLLMNVAQTIASQMHEEDILEIIIDTVVQAIQEADTGFLFLYDEKIDKLRVESAVGFREQSYRKTRLKIGEGVSGRVFQDGKPRMIHEADEIAAAMKNMSKENYKHYINSTIYKKYPNSMISVPLKIHYGTIGVLTIDSFKKGARFTQGDLELLEALSDHVAVVITHAKLYKQEKQQREELQRTHLALRKEHETMQRTTDFHHRLTNIAARGGGAMEIVDTLKQMVRAPFAIYDPLLKPFYIDPEAADKLLPEKFLQHERVKKVMRTNKWQQIVLKQDEILVVIPIVGAETNLGFLCCWAKTSNALESDIVLFEYGSTVLALEWTKQEAIKEARDRIKGEFLEEVLSGKYNPSIENQAQNLGLKTNDFYAVILCKIDQEHPAIRQMPENIRMHKEEWRKRLEFILNQESIQGIVLLNPTYVFALMSFPEEEDKQTARNKVKQIATKMESGHSPVRIGIGRVHKNLVHLNKSYEDAEKCLQILESHPEKQIMSFVEVGIYRFFLQHSTEELELYLTDVLGPLQRYDRQKNRNFMKTLLFYVKYDKELNRITNELSIHPNTLYYRMKRIQDILDVNFEHPEEWFNIQLACQVYDYLSKLNKED